MTNQPQEIIISKSGEVRGIYSPLVKQIGGALGEMQMRRASHVEPTSELRPEAVAWLVDHTPRDQHGLKKFFMSLPDDFATNEQFVHDENTWVRLRDTLPQLAWWADLLPVGGPVLGPFQDRDPALAAEVDWLKEHNIPYDGVAAATEAHPSPPPTAAGQVCQPGN